MSLVKLLTERMMLSDYRRYAKAVTEAYKARPIRDAEAKESYKILNNHNQKMFERLSSKVEVIFTEDDPYKTAEEMTRKVKETGKLYINNQYSDDLPAGWTPEENWKFRAVHDYVVHIGGKVDFSQRGELKAFNVHAKIVPPKALDALFSEVAGQACYATTTGDFPNPQKACKLYGFDYDKVGEIDWSQYRLNFTQDPIQSFTDEQIDRIIDKVKF